MTNLNLLKSDDVTPCDVLELSEESQIILKLLNEYFLTNKWKSLKSIIRELAFFCSLRGMLSVTPREMFATIIDCLYELEDKGHLALHNATGNDFFFRRLIGKVVLHQPMRTVKYDILNGLVLCFGLKKFALSGQNMLTLGHVLRSAGLDWETRRQFSSLLNGLHSMGYISMSVEGESKYLSLSAKSIKTLNLLKPSA